MLYDAAGNMLKKTDLGNNTFKYLAGTNKLKSITANDAAAGSNSYIPGKQRITYTSFDKVRSIGQVTGADTASLLIDCGISRQRIRATTYRNKNLTVRRIYVGQIYEEEYTEADKETKQIYYIFAGGEAIAIHTESNRKDAETLYLHKDHLGSSFKFTCLYKYKVDRKDSMIYCRIPNNIRIKNEPYDPADFSDIQVGDSILFTGTLAGWENDTTIKMIYCIPIPVSKYPINVK